MLGGRARGGWSSDGSSAADWHASTLMALTPVQIEHVPSAGRFSGRESQESLGASDASTSKAALGDVEISPTHS